MSTNNNIRVQYVPKMSASVLIPQFVTTPQPSSQLPQIPQLPQLQLPAQIPQLPQLSAQIPQLPQTNKTTEKTDTTDKITITNLTSAITDSLVSPISPISQDKEDKKRSKNWKLEKGYVELIAEQRTEGWFNARKFRVTASKYATLLGHCRRFESPEEAVDDILGLVEKKEPSKAMKLGTANEDGIRQSFCQLHKIEKVIEPSLCLSLRWFDFPCSWKNNMLLSEMYPNMLDNPDHPAWFVAGSPDGIVYFNSNLRANMEIKFTKDIYPDLKQKSQGTYYMKYRYSKYNNELMSKPFLNLISQCGYLETTGAVDKYPHMYISHLFQTQGCMFITDVKHCAYIVGSLEKEMYSEIIQYDENLWRYYIYPELIRIIETEIKPRMKANEREEFRKNVQEIIDLCKNNNITDERIPFSI